MPQNIMKSRQCQYCGEWFIPTSTRQKYCTKEHHATCIVCNSDFIIKKPFTSITCSRRCSNIYKYGVDNPAKSPEVQAKIRSTMLERYGVEHPLQSKEIHDKFNKTLKDHYGVTGSPYASREIQKKISDDRENKYGHRALGSVPEFQDKKKQTCIERYGVDNPMKNRSIHEKGIQTNIDKRGVPYPTQDPAVMAKQAETVQKKYGVDNVFQSEQIKAKIVETNIARYGVPHALQNEEVLYKREQTCIERYGTPNPMQNEDIMNKSIQTCLEKYGVPHWCMSEEFRHTIDWNTISKTNIRFKELLDSVGLSSSYEYCIGKYLYDLKLDVSSTVIEINPTVTHNVTNGPPFRPNQTISIDYHRKKTEVAIENGYRCIHVFQWESWDKIVDIINPNKVRIYARKCEVREVSEKENNEFLNSYHIQNTCRNQKYRYGLYYNDVLLQVMTFGKPRYNKRIQYELLRLCTKSGYLVIGGSEKLFREFIRVHSPESIISYCDISKFSGNVYERLGMRLEYITNPARHWSRGDSQVTERELMKRGYDRIFNTSYGKGTSNEQLMRDNGWKEVYDCGQAVYKWTKKPN